MAGGTENRRLNGQDPDEERVREGVSVALAVSSEGWKARRGVGGMGRGSSCRRLGRDGEMGERRTANDRLELAAEGWERRFGSWKNLEVMR